MPLTYFQPSQVDSTFNGYLRNRIINGAMMIDQRNAGASGTAVSTYTVDRWAYNASQASKGTWQQNAGGVTPPAGFKNYLGFTSSSAYSVLSADYFSFTQPIEGLNISDLAWGTASASTVTLSFWARSSLTGTFGGSLANSGATRSYPFTYTINGANTWEYKTITIPGDTSGTWLTTNGVGIIVGFSLGMGSTFSGTAGAWAGANYSSATGATSVVGTNGATFYITGVQLEDGAVATPFERRLYNTELQLAQRYYQKSFTMGVAPVNGLNPGNSGMPRYTGWVRADGAFITQFIPFIVPMRASPTINLYYLVGGSASQGYGGIGNAADANITITGIDGSQQSEKGWAFYIVGRTGGNVGQVGVHWDTSGAEL